MTDPGTELAELRAATDRGADTAYNVEDVEKGCPIHTSKLFEDLNSAALMTDIFRWWTKRPGKESLKAIIPQAGKDLPFPEFWKLCHLLFFDEKTDRRNVGRVLLEVLGRDEELKDYFVMVGFPTMFMHFASAEFLKYAIDFLKVFADQPEFRSRLLGSVTLHQTEFINGWKHRLFRALVKESNGNEGRPTLSMDSVRETFRDSLADLPEIVWEMWSELMQEKSTFDNRSAMAREVAAPILLELSVTPEFAAAHDLLCGLAEQVNADLVDQAFSEKPIAWVPPVILDVVYTGELRAWHNNRDLDIVRAIVLKIKSDQRDFYLGPVDAWTKTKDALKRQRAVEFCEAGLFLEGGKAPKVPATMVPTGNESWQRRWKQLKQKARDMHADVQEIQEWEEVRDADIQFQLYVQKHIIAELTRSSDCRNAMRSRMRNWTILTRMAEQQEARLQGAAVCFGLTQMASLMKFTGKSDDEEKVVKLFKELSKVEVSKADLARVFHEYVSSVQSGVDMERFDKIRSHLSLKMVGLTVYAATLGLLQKQNVSPGERQYSCNGDGEVIPPFDTMLREDTELPNPIMDLRYLWTAFSRCGSSKSPGLWQCLNLISIPTMVRQMRQIQPSFQPLRGKNSAFAFFSFIMTEKGFKNFRPDMNQTIGRIEQVSSLCHHFALLPEQFEACQMALRWYPTDC